jgi:amino acid adenylation domain-containing protein
MVLDDSALLLHTQFDEQARKTPDAPALHFRDATLTYGELRTRVERFAAGLRARGVRAGGYVGLHKERSLDYVVSMLGILKCNAAVVPLPLTYPEGRLREILAFAGLDAIVAGANTRIGEIQKEGVFAYAEIAAATTPFVSEPGDSEQPAFVLCSSGSTGKPKMIVRSHQSFQHRLQWTWNNHPYWSDDVCCQKSHMTTTHAIYELFEPLLRGTPVVIMGDADTKNLERFWELVRSFRVSRLLVVPSTLQASLDMPSFIAPAVKVLVLMGEYVHHKLAGRVLDAFPAPTRVYSIYGSTEASSTLVCDLRESYRPGEELPLGRPISADIRALVLNEDLREVAPGETGLLHIGGPALFSEYFKNPVLTAAAFHDAPEGLGRLYDTHDQARVLPDGSLRFVGRTDHTVKVRGFRVDLQEVERTLAQYPAISQSSVLASNDDLGTAKLVGFYTPATVDRTDVFQFLRAQLPDYMIPSTLVALSSFPITSSGKIDRFALFRDHGHRDTTTLLASNQTDTQIKVADVWKKIVGHGNFGLQSSYFEIGGTSLSVFQAVHELRTAFGLERSELDYQSFFMYPTVEKLASCIDSLRSGIPPLAASANSILVTLRKAKDPQLAPFFVIATAGGTLGAYSKLAQLLQSPREVIGVRDSFIWGAREPTMHFKDWVGLYVAAIRERQPQGPYYVGAYSSAGSFGYEIAQQLRAAGQEVARLVLIDPLAIDCDDKRSFGYWAVRGMYGSRQVKWAVLAASRLGRVLPLFSRSPERDNDFGPSAHEWLERTVHWKQDRNCIVQFSALLELNTGLPFTLNESDLEQVAPPQYLAVLFARVKQVAPEIDPAAIENILLQYYCLQVPAQRAYQLKPYDGKVVLFETDGPAKGLLRALFKPHVRDLTVVPLGLGAPSLRTRQVAEKFPAVMRAHYLSMRDDQFAQALAAELQRVLQ